MDLPVNKIICGDAKTELAKLPAESINCCISSPPYWALRDYGVDGQLGLEPTFEEYIDKLCSIYDEVKRVLRKDGTCFVNLGDTYAGSGRGWGGKQAYLKPSFRRDKEPIPRSDFQVPGVSAKSLCLIPQRFAIEMVNRGWILRNTIIWKKPNPMPSSAKDRFTVDFEDVYFFTKNKRYWFEPQYEPYECANPESVSYRKSGKSDSRKDRPNGIMPAFGDNGFWKPDNPLGRNKRCVWTIPTQAEPAAHFATFPNKLVEPMLKAGCPEFVCTQCGKAREKIYEPTMTIKRDQTYDGKQQGQDKQFSHKRIQMLVKAGREAGLPHNNTVVPKEFKGYTDCGCNAEWRPGVCLDMFRGYLHGSKGSSSVAA